MKALPFLVVLGILAISPAAHAFISIEELKPDDPEAPFALEIHSERLANGHTQFTVIISERWLKFPGQVATSLDYVKITKYSPEEAAKLMGHRTELREVHPIRPLPSQRWRPFTLTSEPSADTIKCVFAISDKELDDPNTFFAFNFGSESIISSGTVFYARLKNFMKP